MDCQKATYVQLKRGMAKMMTSLDPEVGTCSRSLSPSPSQPLASRTRRLIYRENLYSYKIVWISKKTLYPENINIPKNDFFVKKKPRLLKHCQKKKTFVSQKKSSSARKVQVGKRGPNIRRGFFFLGNVTVFNCWRPENTHWEFSGHFVKPFGE